MGGGGFVIEKFPTVSGLLLKGPPGVGKMEWCLEHISYCLENQKKVAIVCIDHSPEKIRDRALKLGIDLKEYEGKALVLIDCVSASLGGTPREASSDSTLHVTCLSNIEQIGMSIAKATSMLDGPVNLFFYSLSPLFLHNTSPVLMKFFQIVTLQTRQRQGFGVFVLHDGVHDERTVDTLSMMVDGVIEMRFNNNLQREMRIHHINGVPTRPNWAPFDIGGEILSVALSERIPKVKLIEKKAGIDESV